MNRFLQILIGCTVALSSTTNPSGMATALAQPSQVNVVVTSGVFQTRFADQQSFVGSVEVIRRSVIGSAVDGRVSAVSCEQGDLVIGPSGVESNLQPGQVLVQLETGTLEIEIRAAQIQMQLAEQSLQELTVTLPIELDLAQARLSEARARLSFSEKEAGRLRQLSERNNAISQSELEQARSQFQIDQQLLTQAEFEVKRLESTMKVRIEQAKSRLSATNQELIRLEDQKSKYTIRTPFDGYVVNKLTEVGAWISRGDPIAEIVQLDQVDFTFHVPQEFIGRVQQALANTGEQDNVVISIDGLEQPLSARLMAIAPQVDVRSRLVGVRARLGNPIIGNQPVLKPGMLGKASMAVGNPRDMVVVSRDALVLGGSQPVIYKVIERDSKTTVVPIVVKIGASQGEWTEVIGDLAPGDSVVVEGNERLRPNAEIKISSKRGTQPAS